MSIISIGPPEIEFIPCDLPCCPGPCGCAPRLPDTLHATITNYSHCTLLNGNTYALTYGIWGYGGVGSGSGSGTIPTFTGPGWGVRINDPACPIGQPDYFQLVLLCGWGLYSDLFRTDGGITHITGGGSALLNQSSPCNPLNISFALRLAVFSCSDCDPTSLGGDLAGNKSTVTVTL
jgi:hypothetical protein